MAKQNANTSPNRVIILNIITPPTIMAVGSMLDNSMVKSASRTPMPPGAPGVINPPIQAKTLAQTTTGRLPIFK